MLEIVWVDKFLEIIKMYGEYSVYILMYNSVTIVDRNSNIVKEYNGRNIDDLRVRYRISDKQLKNILINEGKLIKNWYY